MLSDKINTLNTNAGISHIQMETFSGDEPTQAKMWMNKYDTFTTLHGYTDDKRITALPLFLKGKALRWFTAQDLSSIDWFYVKQLFLERYAPSSIQQYQRLDRLYNRKQKTTEPFKDFLQDIISESKILHRFSEEFIKDSVIRNAKPAIRQFILQRPHETYDDVMESACLADNTISTDSDPNDKVLSSIDELKQALSVMTLAFKRNDNNNINKPSVRFQIPETNNTRSDFSGHPGQRRIPSFNRLYNTQMGQRYPIRYNRDNRSSRTCFRCGEYHREYTCFARNYKCYNCQRIGHLSRQCPDRRRDYR
jgi:hypothetical protein